VNEFNVWLRLAGIAMLLMSHRISRTWTDIALFSDAA